MKLLFALLLLVLSASAQAQYHPNDPRAGYGEYARPDNCFSAYGCNTVVVIPPPRPLPPPNYYCPSCGGYPVYGHRPPYYGGRPPYYGGGYGYGSSGYAGSIGVYNNGYNTGVSGSFSFYKNKP